MDPEEDTTNKPKDDEVFAEELELSDDDNKEDYPKLGNVVILGSKPTNDAKVQEIAKKIDLINSLDVGLANQANIALIDEGIKLKVDIMDSNVTNTDLSYANISFIDEGVKYTDTAYVDTNRVEVNEENIFYDNSVKVELCDPLYVLDNNNDDNYGFEIVNVESNVEEIDDTDIISIKSECVSSPSLKLVYSSEDESIHFNTNDTIAIKVEPENCENNIHTEDISEDMDILYEIDELINNTGTKKSIESNKDDISKIYLDNTNVDLNNDFSEDIIIIEDDSLDNCAEILNELINTSAVENPNVDNDSAKNTIQSNKPTVNTKEIIDEVIKIKDEIIIIEDDNDEKDNIDRKGVIETFNKKRRFKTKYENSKWKYKCVVCSKILNDYCNAENHRKFYHGHMTSQFIFKKLKPKSSKPKLKTNYFRKFYNKMLNDLKSELFKAKTADDVKKINAIDEEIINDKGLQNNINDNKQEKTQEDEILNESNEKTVNLYQCHCGLHYLSTQNLKRHVKTCIGEELNQKCFICYRPLAKSLYFEHLKQHEATKNVTFNIIDLKSSYNCKYSKFDFHFKKYNKSNINEAENGIKSVKTNCENAKNKSRKTKTYRKLRKLKPKSYKEDLEDNINTNCIRYYKCYKCPIYYRSIGGAEYHLSKKHNIVSTVTCEICKLQLNTKGLEVHKSLHKNNINYFHINVFGENCKIIDTYIHNIDDLNYDSGTKDKYNSNDSSTDDYEVNDSDSQDTDTIEDVHQTIYNCKECSVNFPTIATFLDHMFYRRDNELCNSDEETRFCQYCGRIFYTQHIREHEEVHHKDKKVGDKLIVIDKDPTKVIKEQSSEAKILNSSKLVSIKKTNGKRSTRTNNVDTNKSKPKDTSASNKDKVSKGKNSTQENGTKKLKLSRCNLCFSYFNSKRSLAGHRRHCTSQIVCIYCNKKFIKSHLIKHLEFHAKENSASNFDETAKNKNEDNSFNNIEADRNKNTEHIEKDTENKLIHNKDNNVCNRTNQPEVLQSNEQNKNAKLCTVYKCGQCLTHLNTLDAMYTHMHLRAHIEVNDHIICKMCKLKFSNDSFIYHANLHFTVNDLELKVETFNTIEDVAARIKQDTTERSKSNNIAKLRAVRIRSRQSEDKKTEENFPTIEEITQAFNDLEEEAIKILQKKKESKRREQFNNEIYKLMTDNCNYADISVQNLITASVENRFKRSDYPNLSAVNSLVNTNNTVTVPSVIPNGNNSFVNQKQCNVNQVETSKKATTQLSNENNYLTNITSNIKKLRQESDMHLRYLLNQTDIQSIPIDFSLKNNVNSNVNIPNNLKTNRSKKVVRKNSINTCVAEINPSNIVNYNVNNYDNSNNIYFVGGHSNIPTNSDNFRNNNTTNQTSSLKTQDDTNVQRSSVIKHPCYSNTNYIVNTNAYNINNVASTSVNVANPGTEITENFQNYTFINYNPDRQSNLLPNAAGMPIPDVTISVKPNKRTNTKETKRNVNSKKTKTSANSTKAKIKNNNKLVPTAKRPTIPVSDLFDNYNYGLNATDGHIREINNVLAPNKTKKAHVKGDFTNTYNNKIDNSSINKQLNDVNINYNGVNNYVTTTEHIDLTKNNEANAVNVVSSTNEVNSNAVGTKTVETIDSNRIVTESTDNAHYDKLREFVETVLKINSNRIQ